MNVHFSFSRKILVAKTLCYFVISWSLRIAISRQLPCLVVVALCYYDPDSQPIAWGSGSYQKYSLTLLTSKSILNYAYYFTHFTIFFENITPHQPMMNFFSLTSSTHSRTAPKHPNLHQIPKIFPNIDKKSSEDCSKMEY